MDKPKMKKFLFFFYKKKYNPQGLITIDRLQTTLILIPIKKNNVNHPRSPFNLKLNGLRQFFFFLLLSNYSTDK